MIVQRNNTEIVMHIKEKSFWVICVLSGIAQVHCCPNVPYLLCGIRCNSGKSMLHVIVCMLV